MHSLLKQLKSDEGLRLRAYKDTLGNWTIGYGHTGREVQHGLIWTEKQAEEALLEDIEEAKALANRLEWFPTLNEPRQAALINMFFQMGNKVFQFKRTLAAIRDGRYEDARESGLRSLWARQTPARAKRVMTQIATGEWEY